MSWVDHEHYSYQTDVTRVCTGRGKSLYGQPSLGVVGDSQSSRRNDIHITHLTPICLSLCSCLPISSLIPATLSANNLQLRLEKIIMQISFCGTRMDITLIRPEVWNVFRTVPSVIIVRYFCLAVWPGGGKIHKPLSWEGIKTNFPSLCTTAN